MKIGQPTARLFMPAVLKAGSAIGLLVVLWLLNPALWHFGPPVPEPFQSDAPRPILRGAEAAITPVTFNYREDVQHSGVHDQSFVGIKLREAWRTPQLNIGVHGASKSSPAVDASGVYVGSDAGWFYHFDLQGHEIWRFRVGSSRRGIHATATLDADHVYIGGYNGRLYCLEKSTGKIVWISQLVNAIGASPVIDGDGIYVSCERTGVTDGYLFKLDRRTGRVIWNSINFGEQGHSTPTLDRHGRVFLGANNGKFFAFSTATGKLLWVQKLGQPIKSTSFVHENVVYFTDWSPDLVALDAVTGHELWRERLHGKSQSSPTFIPDQNLVIFASHVPPMMYGVSLGSKIHEAELKSPIERSENHLLWRHAPEKSNSFHFIASGVAVRERAGSPYYIWIACSDAALCAIAPKTGVTLARIELGTTLTGIPTVFETSLFVATDSGSLIRFDDVSGGN